jgi:hypothetical protein
MNKAYLEPAEIEKLEACSENTGSFPEEGRTAANKS